MYGDQSAIPDGAIFPSGFPNNACYIAMVPSEDHRSDPRKTRKICLS